MFLYIHMHESHLFGYLTMYLHMHIILIYLSYLNINTIIRVIASSISVVTNLEVMLLKMHRLHQIVVTNFGVPSLTLFFQFHT